MVFWKLGLCLAILAAASSSGKPLEDEVEEMPSAEIINFIPKMIKMLPKEELQNLVNLFRSMDKESSKVVNDHVDSILLRCNDYIISQGLDPTPLPDEGFDWEFIFLLIKYTCEMTLKDGWLQGMGTLERHGDCHLTSDGEKLLLKLSLKFETLLFNYNYRAKLMGIGPKGGVDGRITGSRFTINVAIDPVTLEAELHSYKLNKGGNMSIKFTGNILVDWIVNMFVNMTLIFLKPVMKIFISGWVLDAVNVLIVTYNEFVCGLQGLC